MQQTDEILSDHGMLVLIFGKVVFELLTLNLVRDPDSLCSLWDAQQMDDILSNHGMLTLIFGKVVFRIAYIEPTWRCATNRQANFGAKAPAAGVPSSCTSYKQPSESHVYKPTQVTSVN